MYLKLSQQDLHSHLVPEEIDVSASYERLNLKTYRYDLNQRPGAIGPWYLDLGLVRCAEADM